MRGQIVAAASLDEALAMAPAEVAPRLTELAAGALRAQVDVG